MHPAPRHIGREDRCAEERPRIVGPERKCAKCAAVAEAGGADGLASCREVFFPLKTPTTNMSAILVFLLAVAAAAHPNAFPDGKLVLGYAPSCDVKQVPQQHVLYFVVKTLKHFLPTISPPSPSPSAGQSGGRRRQCYHLVLNRLGS